MSFPTTREPRKTSRSRHGIEPGDLRQLQGVLLRHIFVMLTMALRRKEMLFG